MQIEIFEGFYRDLKLTKPQPNSEKKIECNMLLTQICKLWSENNTFHVSQTLPLLQLL